MQIRPFEPQDEAFVIKTTLGSFPHVSVHLRPILERNTAGVRVMEHNDVILGFAFPVRRALLLVYVKPQYRGQGVGSVLAAEFPRGTEYPFKAPARSRLAKRFTYNPCCLWE